MKIQELALRAPVTVRPDATVHDAAVAMARGGIGCLLVTEGDVPVGLVTDRDLVVRGLACRVPDDARVDALMTTSVVTVDAADDVRDVIRSFGQHAVRRLPVVSGGHVVGMVTIDDLVLALHDQLADLTRGVTAQLLFPHGADEAPLPVPAS